MKRDDRIREYSRNFDDEKKKGKPMNNQKGIELRRRRGCRL